MLKQDGLLILTTPDPFFDKIAETLSGDYTGHQISFFINALRELLITSGFDIARTKKLMLTPIGLLGEIGIEAVITGMHMGAVLLNRQLVGRKL